jgi:hypothetical protein
MACFWRMFCHWRKDRCCHVPDPFVVYLHILPDPWVTDHRLYDPRFLDEY